MHLRAAMKIDISSSVYETDDCVLSCAQGEDFTRSSALILTAQLALTPGTRLGVYDLTAPIGEGGPSPLARATRELRRDRAEAKVMRCR
jgi:hypothetical protein